MCLEAGGGVAIVVEAGGGATVVVEAGSAAVRRRSLWEAASYRCQGKGEAVRSGKGKPPV